MKKSIVFLFYFACLVSSTLVLAQSADIKSKIIAIDSTEPTINGKRLCLDNVEAMSACRSFIKGFLQGALLTDTAIIESIEKAEPSFSSRAIRTRIGSRSSAPTELAGFCLPADRTIFQIAEETLDHVKSSERNSVELAENVYQSLKKDYPC